jgi:hypothetical protein
MATVLLSRATDTLRGFQICVRSGALTRRLVHPTAPVLLTKSGPLGAQIRMPRASLE